MLNRETSGVELWSTWPVSAFLQRSSSSLDLLNKIWVIHWVGAILEKKNLLSMTVEKLLIRNGCRIDVVDGHVFVANKSPKKDTPQNFVIDNEDTAQLRIKQSHHTTFDVALRKAAQQSLRLGGRSGDLMETARVRRQFEVVRGTGGICEHVRLGQRLAVELSIVRIAVHGEADLVAV